MACFQTDSLGSNLLGRRAASQLKKRSAAATYRVLLRATLLAQPKLIEGTLNTVLGNLVQENSGASYVVHLRRQF